MIKRLFARAAGAIPGSFRFGVFAAVLFLLAPLFLAGQAGNVRGHITGGDDINAIRAADEFRIGIQAFNRFAFNEAIHAFERALSFRPGEAIIMDWLGRAYYRSGFENIALQQWRAAVDAYGRGTEAGMVLASRIETVSNRRTLLPVADDNVRYVQSGRYPGNFRDHVLYRQPTSVLPQPDGSAWVVAFGSNELVRIGVNGTIRERRRGPIQGFDRPYDITRGLDGRLYVSEYRGGRVSILYPDGRWQAHIGSRGRGAGQFIGPKNMTIDEYGYLYVVDFG
ncbi:MAG: 6-bladed beta-propeller, partial [Treponema sp.]|nr:6-bladed beta-propeller [Treponema sp.]